MFTGFQTSCQSNRRAKPGASRAIALVCLALLALLTVAQVAHTHPNASDADHCTLCIVMHTVVPVAATQAVITLVHVAAARPVLEVRAVILHWHPQIFIRPPPAVS